VVCGAAGAGALLIVGYVWLTGPPSDATLERAFGERESDLQQRVLLAQQDKHLTRIAPDFTWLDTDAPWPRAKRGIVYGILESLSRFVSVHRTSGGNCGGHGCNFFSVCYAGIVPVGFSKGYVYSFIEDPAPVVSSLNNGRLFGGSLPEDRELSVRRQ
jgi:hypothetical protein